MSDNPTAKSRTLMKDGIWQVPSEERPSGWREMPVREPDTVQNTRIVVVTAGVPDILRCACGRPLRHATGCMFRVLSKWVARKRWLAAFNEHVPAIRESGKAFGADEPLMLSGLVLFASMWTRRPAELCHMVRARIRDITPVAQRYQKYGIWNDDMSVFLGVETTADLGFWLVAMVGAGTIGITEDRQFYSLKKKTA